MAGAEAERLERGRAARAELEALGAVPRPSGSGARCARTTRADGDCLGLLPARPRAQPRLPLGRGRPARASPTARAGSASRSRCGTARPDPQGAALRPHRPRGQPRRGREGVLLLPRRDADALLHEGALQVPAGRVPVRAARRGEPAPRQATSPSSSCVDTGVFDDGPLLRRRSPSTPRRRRTTSSSGSRSPTAGRRRRRCTCCRRSGSATPGRGAARARATGRKPTIRPATATASSRRARRRSGGSASRPSRPDGGRAASCSSPRTRRTPSGSSARRTATPYVKDAFHEYVVDGDADAVNPDRVGHEGRGALPARRSRPAATVTCGCGCARRPRRRRRPSGAAFDARLRRRASREADEFYAERHARRR